MKKIFIISLCLLVAGCAGVRSARVDPETEHNVITVLKLTMVSCPDLCHWISITDKVQELQHIIDDCAPTNTALGELRPQVRLDVPQDKVGGLPPQSVVSKYISAYDILTEIARQAKLDVVVEGNQVFLRYRKD